MSQVLRWRPTTPSALPHVLTRDERVGDYHFTKGTTFLANVWSIHRNEEEYERPDEFMPERFLDNPYGVRGSMSSKTEDMDSVGRRDLYTFGSGRRLCPGIQFAFTSVLAAASKVVWAYDILPPLEGVDLSIETGFMDGVVTQPVNPRVRFRLRNDERLAGITQDYLQTEAVVKDLLG